MNEFQWYVVQGLGWVAVLFDGWVLHSHWLALLGFAMMALSIYFIIKKGN